MLQELVLKERFAELVMICVFIRLARLVSLNRRVVVVVLIIVFRAKLAEIMLAFSRLARHAILEIQLVDCVLTIVFPDNVVAEALVSARHVMLLQLMILIDALMHVLREQLA